jgi:hypothetical protein
VPVPETRTEPNNESLSTRLTEAQQEVHTQPVPDARYFLGIEMLILNCVVHFNHLEFFFFLKFWCLYSFWFVCPVIVARLTSLLTS